jgi:hypothetical protein
MLDLPHPGDRVYVWPAPGLKVQDGATPISDGGRWLPVGGRQVVWTEFHHRQFVSGELLITDPTARPASAKPAPVPGEFAR